MKISGLKKVHLSLKAVEGKDRKSSNESTSISFIYGAASGGLIPFEIELAGRLPGEEFQIVIQQSEIALFFGHLLRSLKMALGSDIISHDLFLYVVITEVEDAHEREIIRAMAAAISGNCGGDCDCECC